MADFVVMNRVLIGYRGNSENVVIPKNVNKIGDDVFVNKKLKKIIIPNSVEEIGFRAFKNNQITEVTIPKSVKVIGSYAFCNNPLKHLTMFTIIEELGIDIYNYLENLTIINEGNIIEFLGKLQRSGNLKNVRNIEIKGKPLTEEEIKIIKNKFGEYNIKYDDKEETIINSKEDFVIENGVLIEYRGNSEDVVIQDGVKIIDSLVFSDFGLKSVVIPNSIEVIGFRAFADNQITEVIIPSNVKLIGNFTFANNPLEHLTMFTTFKEVGDKIFGNIAALTIINEGKIIEFLDKLQRSGNLESARNIEIKGKPLTEEEIETIKNKFGKYNIKYDTKEETNINSKEDFVIENGVLLNYKGTSDDIVIPEGVKIIDSFALENLGLRSVVIPDSVEEIRYTSFADNLLTNIIIPKSVTEIGRYAFIGNPLEHLMISTKVEKIGVKIIKELKVLTIINDGNIIEFLNKLKETGNLENVRNIEIQGKSLTEKEIEFIKNKFGEYKIKYDTKEKENINNEEDFVIKNGLLIKYRGYNRDIVIPDGIRKICDNAFCNKRLKKVIISNSVEEIGINAFADNQITNVIIPSSVKLIGKWAFYNNSLKYLTMSTTIKELSIDIYNYLENLTIINEGKIIEFLDKLQRSGHLKNVRNIEIQGKSLTEEEMETIKNKFGEYKIKYDFKEKRANLDEEKNMELMKKEKEYQTPININAISSMAFDLAKNDDLANALGRDTEIEKLIKSLCIKGSSVLLLGDAGVGKTALVESLALQVRNGTNKWLKDKVILSVDTSAVVSGARYLGEFEKKFNDVLNLAREYKGRVILFIDEFHTLYGLGRGKDSGLDAMNMLKPLISSRDITVIGATTVDEYQEYIAKDKAFVRRFEQVKLSPLSLDLNIDVLVDYMAKLERKYKIEFPYNERQRRVIAKYIVEKTDVKYQRVVGTTPTTNPTLAKSVLEDAFVDAVYNEGNSVTIKDICVSISSCDKLSNNTINPLNLESMLNIMPEDNKVISFPR